MEDDSVSKVIENLWKSTSLLQSLGSHSGKIEIMNSIISMALSHGNLLLFYILNC